MNGIYESLPFETKNLSWDEYKASKEQCRTYPQPNYENSIATDYQKERDMSYDDYQAKKEKRSNLGACKTGAKQISKSGISPLPTPLAFKRLHLHRYQKNMMGYEFFNPRSIRIAGIKTYLIYRCEICKKIRKIRTGKRAFFSYIAYEYRREILESEGHFDLAKESIDDIIRREECTDET
jgi:hypothetical protein